jgi:hypothetical protein
MFGFPFAQYVPNDYQHFPGDRHYSFVIGVQQ